ncbi:MAG: hypothetical protein WBB82_14095, partial [Limnothrix sp.]
SKASSINKGLGKGNKIHNIPPALDVYSDFLRCNNNVKWIKWHINGNNFTDFSEVCPYCTSTIDDKKDTISLIGKEYDAKSIEHLNKIIEVIENLNQYFNQEVQEKLTLIAQNSNGLSEEGITYLKVIKLESDTLCSKLKRLKEISFFSFQDIVNAKEFIESLKIEIGLFSHLNSSETDEIITQVNESLDSVLDEIGILQGEIANQKKNIQKTIDKNKSNINDFLKEAGYQYYVEVENDLEEYKVRLKHKDSTKTISHGTQHLSFGEKNAFALVLFMYECLKSNPDLIILDDPVSSFDNNKKFAIINKLFKKKDSFQEKTVLMMTHDLEPIIDMIYSLRATFQPIPHASFLKIKEGTLREIEITKDDIETFSQICINNIELECKDVIKVIYLRRYYETINNKNNEYQLLSSLLHKHERPYIKRNGEETPMQQSEIEEATRNIKEKMLTFDYQSILDSLKDEQGLLFAYKDASNNYERLQLFRIIEQDKHGSLVVNKYINEAFHIENETIMQLNPHKYDVIPDYIIKECDAVLFP